MSPPKIVCANPLRSPSDSHAAAMDSAGLLRLYLVGTRRLTKGIQPEHQRLYPVIGLVDYLAARFVGGYRGESIRFASCPVFERWVLPQLKPGDHLLAGFGYLNRCLLWVKENGGLALLEARNSHPSNFWSLVAEEYAHWGCKLPPIYPRHHMRQQQSVALADYIFSPSDFVTESFVTRGFPAERILQVPYPVDVTVFKPATEPRPKERPLTLVNTGQLSLRKGTPYLMEAFIRVRKEIPNARLLLTKAVASNFQPIFQKYGWDRLPIEWAGALPHNELAKRLQGADIFVMPSIEEGMVRTVAEAMSCNLPVIVTKNTGTSDIVRDGINGSIVPIRDSRKLADSVLEWWQRIHDRTTRSQGLDESATQSLSLQRFSERLLTNLEKIGLRH